MKTFGLILLFIVFILTLMVIIGIEYHLSNDGSNYLANDVSNRDKSLHFIILPTAILEILFFGYYGITLFSHGIAWIGILMFINLLFDFYDILKSFIFHGGFEVKLARKAIKEQHYSKFNTYECIWFCINIVLTVIYLYGLFNY